MASRGKGRRGCPRDNSQSPPVFDPQAFIDVIGTAVAIIAQVSLVAATISLTSVTMGQGGTSNLQGFQPHHPQTYMGGGNSMVKTTLAIGRDVDDTWSIRDMGVGAKRKENQSSSNSRNKQKTSTPRGFQGRGHDYQGQGRVEVSRQKGQMPCYHCHQPRHMRRNCF